MRWTDPIVLLTLLALPLLAALWLRETRRRRAAVDAFGTAMAQRFEATVRTRNRTAALMIGAVGMMSLALAGPRYGLTTEERTHQGIDLVIAVDVSRSMLAEDVPPSRLERARFELSRSLDALAGSRIGVVLFAGEAFLQCPLTTDLGTVRRFLSTAHPDLVPAQGTDIGAAIRTAVEAFSLDDASAADPRSRAILVVTDGEDHPDRVAQALRAAENAGVAVFAMGIGTEDGAPIPLIGPDGRRGFHMDRAGQPVITQLAEGTLRQLGGSRGYSVIGGATGDLSQTISALQEMDRSIVGVDSAAVLAERFQWPLAISVLLMLAFGWVQLRMSGREIR